MSAEAGRARLHFLCRLTNFDKKIKYDSLKYSRRCKKVTGRKFVGRGAAAIVGAAS